MSLVSDQDWKNFGDLMYEAHKSFSQKIITWVRNDVKISRWREDPHPAPIEVNLEVLLNYNYMRTWPISNITETGETDEQSVQVLINKQYLKENNWLNTDGYFIYNTDSDRFIIDGLEYKPFGDTAVSQGKTDDFIISLVLKRKVIPTDKLRT